MKTLGILLVSTTLLLAGCACDCKDKVGDNAFEIDSAQGTTGTHVGANGHDNATHTGSAYNGSIRGNPSTDANDTSASAKTNDPRTYGTSSGGIGYRTDTLDEYKGINGSARDKGKLDQVPTTPK